SDHFWEHYHLSEMYLIRLSEKQTTQVSTISFAPQSPSTLSYPTQDPGLRKQIRSYHAQMEAYLHLSAILLQTSSLDDAHPILRQMQVAMEDVRTTQDKIYFHLHTHTLSNLSNASLQGFYQQIVAVIQVQKQLLQDIRQGDARQQDEHLRKMNQLLPRLIEMKGKGMAAIPRRRGSKHDPLMLCERIIQRLTDFSQAIQFYPAHLAIPRLYQPFGKSAYALNHAFVNILDAKGEGTIDLFNRWSSLLEIDVVPISPELPSVWLPPAPQTFVAPRQIVMLMDGSGSMIKNQRYRRALSPIRSGIQYARAVDQLQFVLWADEPQLVSWEYIQAHKPEGELPLQAGIELAVAQALEGSDEAHVWIITDGGFETSPQMLRWIERQSFRGLHMHFAYVGDHPKEQLPRLRDLAKIGGGTCFNLHDVQDQRSWKKWWSCHPQQSTRVLKADFSGR
ncbi:MAG: hypothetical protein AAFR59_02385, partial [Bacteroidota bacterium]